MGIFESLNDPADLAELDPAALPVLARELREFLVGSVCRTGGHLGPNLGVVELTIALHRVFRSPATPLVFDTGHQAYVHKLLTGRRQDFASLRQAGGLSGYPSRAESEHDVVENSHASTALSYADGLSKAFDLGGQDREVVAVIGDGALTGGLAWEALNNLGSSGRRVIVVLNDNGRSYAPTVGGLPRHLDRLKDRQGYAALVSSLGGTPTSQHGGFGDGAFGDTTFGDTTFGDGAQSVFGALGLDYLGPVDGHDLVALEQAFRAASGRRRPVVVHCRTIKGQGYQPAEDDGPDRMHSVGVIDATTGRAAGGGTPLWTDAFGAAMLRLGQRRPHVVAVSAAMVGPTGLQAFADRFPERCFDTGIAEQHAVTSAAGLAMAGAHPVVALYATFLNRAFDQTLLDVGLHRLPVTFVLDRAGITGPDGPSHHGGWDLALLGAVPGMQVAAPRDCSALAEQLDEAVSHASGPTALRFPKATQGVAVPAVERWCGMDVLRSAPRPQVLLVAVGPVAAAALEAAEQLAADGVECTVVDPRWVLPVNPALVDLAAGHALVVTAEDGVRAAGVGSRVAQLLADAGCTVPVRTAGLPTDFLPQGGRGELLQLHGLDGAGLARTVRSALGEPVSSRDRFTSRRWPRRGAGAAANLQQLSRSRERA